MTSFSNLRRYYPEIEGLRGLLAVTVLFGHLAATLTIENPLWWSWGSMEVFFCVSGFLITRNFLIKYKGYVSSGYFVNRVLRIWPMYYVAWLFAAVVTYVAGSRVDHTVFSELSVPSGAGAWLPAVFLQHVENYGSASFDDRSLALFYHSWSIALEEQFYLVLAPLLFVLCRKRSLGFVLTIAISLIGLTSLARYYGLSTLTLVGRLEGFSLGIAMAFIEVRCARGERLAAFFHRPAGYSVILVYALVSVGLYVAECKGRMGTFQTPYRVYAWPLVNPSLGFALLAFSVLGFIATANTRGVISWLLRRSVLQRLGRISYSIYLLHVPIVYSLCPVGLTNLGLDLRWSLLVSPALVVALSWGSYQWIERPFLKMRVPGWDKSNRTQLEIPVNVAVRPVNE